MATPFLFNFKYYSQVNIFKHGDYTIQKLGVADEVKKQTNKKPLIFKRISYLLIWN